MTKTRNVAIAAIALSALSLLLSITLATPAYAALTTTSSSSLGQQATQVEKYYSGKSYTFHFEGDYLWIRVYFGNQFKKLEPTDYDCEFESKIKIPKEFFNKKLVVKAKTCEGDKLILQKSKVYQSPQKSKNSKITIDKSKTLKWFKSTSTFKNMTEYEWVSSKTSDGMPKNKALLIDRSKYWDKRVKNWVIYRDADGWGAYCEKDSITLQAYNFKKVNGTWYYISKERVEVSI